MTPKCPARFFLGCSGSVCSQATYSILNRSRQSYSTGPSPAQSYNPGYSGGSGGANRAFPQYSVYGSESLLTIKPLLPSFKPAGGDGIALDKRGKIMLGFTPAASDGTRFLWDQQIQMALSVEEVGLIVNQLPAHPVELSRSGSQGEGGTAEGMMTGVPDKVLTISPGEGAMVTFALDYVLDGVGGQISQLDTNSVNAPMEVIAQAGEFEVVKLILQQSIPYLVGWPSMMDIAVGNAVRAGRSGAGGYGK